MHTLYFMLQQLGDNPDRGPGKPIFRFTGILPDIGDVTTSFTSLLALLLLFALPDIVSLYTWIVAELFMVVPGIKNTADCSIPVTPLLQAEGVAE